MRKRNKKVMDEEQPSQMQEPFEEENLDEEELAQEQTDYQDQPCEEESEETSEEVTETEPDEELQEELEDDATLNQESEEDQNGEQNLENDDNQEATSQDEVAKVVTETPDYLNMARRIQADFDNFRRHALEDVKKARIDGQASVIEVFLPCLDTFKEAKKSITDESVLKGVEMIENKINEALNQLGVVRLESIGQVYDPHLHNVIAVMRDETKDNDIILDEFQAGYKFNDKVLRYAKVIVNKKED